MQKISDMDHNSGVDQMQNLPSPKFSQKILKSVIGDDRASQVLQSISMNNIPKFGSGFGLGAGN